MPNPTVLVVNGQSTVASMLVALLEKEGFTAVSADSGGMAEVKLRSSSYELVILDTSLNDEEGLTIVRRLRRWNGTPILFVAPRRDCQVKIAALELGCNDVIEAPYDAGELIARARNLIGFRKEQSQTVCFDRYRIDHERRVVMDETGDFLTLTRAEFDILAALLKGNGRVLTRQQLLDATVHTHEDTRERVIDVLVSRLRKKLEPQGPPWTIIRTVPGLGYQLGFCKSRSGRAG